MAEAGRTQTYSLPRDDPRWVRGLRCPSDRPIEARASRRSVPTGFRLCMTRPLPGKRYFPSLAICSVAIVENRLAVSAAIFINARYRRITLHLGPHSSDNTLHAPCIFVPITSTNHNLSTKSHERAHRPPANRDPLLASVIHPVPTHTFLILFLFSFIFLESQPTFQIARDGKDWNLSRPRLYHTLAQLRCLNSSFHWCALCRGSSGIKE